MTEVYEAAIPRLNAGASLKQDATLPNLHLAGLFPGLTPGPH